MDRAQVNVTLHLAMVDHQAASARPSGKRVRNYLEKTDQTMHSAGGVVMCALDAARWLELIIEDGRPRPGQRTKADRNPNAGSKR